jgi:peptidyl-tRNA hydrolase
MNEQIKNVGIGQANLEKFIDKTADVILNEFKPSDQNVIIKELLSRVMKNREALINQSKENVERLTVLYEELPKL